MQCAHHISFDAYCHECLFRAVPILAGEIKELNRELAKRDRSLSQLKNEVDFLRSLVQGLPGRSTAEVK